jgi:hypothetical protein
MDRQKTALVVMGIEERPIAEESVEEAVATTDLGRALLDGNRWVTLLLLEELQQVGVPLDHTLIEQQVGGDELDCSAVVSGDLAFFELKVHCPGFDAVVKERNILTLGRGLARTSLAKETGNE